MTLFLCQIDSDDKKIRWVNAGHDPALVYDPDNDAFVELAGHSLPLGVTEKTGYHEFQRPLSPQQVVLIGTDGIWEAQSTRGNMFGKKRFQDVVRSHAGESAGDILQAVLMELDKFCRPRPKDDDVTLVIIKVTS